MSVVSTCAVCDCVYAWLVLVHVCVFMSVVSACAVCVCVCVYAWLVLMHVCVCVFVCG